MNCDDFLEALESPAEQVRIAARKHATACPNCAELADVHARLLRELGSAEPLPQRMRVAWKAAADELPQTTLVPHSQERSAGSLPLAIVSFAAALLLLISVFLLTGQRHVVVVVKPQEEKEPVPLPPIAVVKMIDASAELNELLSQVNALEAELKDTTKDAELLDARREANVLLATYNHW